MHSAPSPSSTRDDVVSGDLRTERDGMRSKRRRAAERGGHRCQVKALVGLALQLHVIDDGRGPERDRRHGVGQHRALRAIDLDDRHLRRFAGDDRDARRGDRRARASEARPRPPHRSVSVTMAFGATSMRIASRKNAVFRSTNAPPDGRHGRSRPSHGRVRTVTPAGNRSSDDSAAENRPLTMTR